MTNTQPQKLSFKAMKVWRIESFVTYSILICLLSVFLFLINQFNWAEWLTKATIVTLIIIFLFAVYEILLVPGFRYKRWRYIISKDFIELRKGNLFWKNTWIIPSQKIQYVSIDQGLIARKYKVSNIKIGTLSSIHELPTLEEDTAEELRKKIVHISNSNA
ncbi:PH domain-containing protein [Marinococcus sp. PL1-022]|uniref:PH domain-containing protein n=1 Tax=Marinococcus sp. PL1-022 TaxID=3095363 RepID=UPI0029C59BAA|nr:PH domain-containing protein [Marinococcus sp. PL1-022]MDX6154476.1 PH domain-containing protein [Marinococcus sp. PL1-022]